MEKREYQSYQNQGKRTAITGGKEKRKGGKTMTNRTNPYMAAGHVSCGPGCSFDARTMNQGASTQMPSNSSKAEDGPEGIPLALLRNIHA
jgi:hypothetical protein